MMITMEGIVTEDRQLLVNMPDIVPAGRVRITIVSLEPLPPLIPMFLLLVNRSFIEWH